MSNKADNPRARSRPASEAAEVAAAGAGCGAAAAAAVEIWWPSALPVVRGESEAAFARALDAAAGGSRAAWARSEPCAFEALPPAAQRAVADAAAAAGLALCQAASLRAQLQLSAAPWRFHGSEAASLAAATALEAAVARFLAAAGARFATQADMAVSQPGGTPDFLLDPPVRINGARVRWIEVKRFFGTGLVAGLRPWLPVLKMRAQLERYKAAFGPGALVLISGHSETFAARWPDILLLDASELDGVDFKALL